MVLFRDHYQTLLLMFDVVSRPFGQGCFYDFITHNHHIGHWSLPHLLPYDSYHDVYDCYASRDSWSLAWC